MNMQSIIFIVHNWAVRHDISSHWPICRSCSCCAGLVTLCFFLDNILI